MEFVQVAAGPFWMGWDEGLPGERPRHHVWVDAFAIARTPVTRAEYAAYLRATGAAPPPGWDDPRFADPRQPAVGVSWHDAVGFCNWLGPAHRLPTEAEWEKAARGGLDGARFPWGNASPGGRLDRPPLVGSTPANPLGLTELSGCCHEWCLDWDADDSYKHSPARNPAGPGFGTRRVSRGGAWRHADPWSPVARRSSLPPGLRYLDYGVRVVRAGGPAGLLAPPRGD